MGDNSYTDPMFLIRYTRRSVEDARELARASLGEASTHVREVPGGHLVHFSVWVPDEIIPKNYSKITNGA